MLITKDRSLAATVAVLLFAGPVAADGFVHTYQGKPINLSARDDGVAVIAADLARITAGTGLDIVEPWTGSRWTVLRSSSGVVDHAAVAAGLREAGAASYVSPVFTTPDDGRVIVAPELFIAFDADLPDAQIMAILADTPTLIPLDADYLGMPGMVRARADVGDAWEVLALADALAALPAVRFVEPNLLMTARLDGETPDDEHFFRQWALHATGQNITEGVPGAPPFIVLPDFDMDALEAWNVSSGDPSSIVVIFDQGIQFDHPDLDVAFGEDFTDAFIFDEPGAPVFACDNHGTAVAGTVGAIPDNGIGVSGLCPDCGLASARIFNPLPVTPPCTSSVMVETQWILNALDWSSEIGARVTNHSYTMGAPSDTLDAMFALTRANGMVHFAAAGNSANPVIGYPASSPFVNGVSALEPIVGGLADFSNYGEGLSVAAPGELIVTTDRSGDDGYSGGAGTPSFDDYTGSSGTSFASPYGAAVAGLVASAFPELTAVQIETVIQRTAVDLGDPGYDLLYGWGFANAGHALAADVECLLTDFDGSGAVDAADLSMLLASWGACPECPADLDGNGMINHEDLSILLVQWGVCGTP